MSDDGNSTEKQQVVPELSERQFAYIQAHVECLGVKTKAAEKAGIPIRTVTDWFLLPHFVQAVKDAVRVWKDFLVAAGMQRAMTKSDVLTMFFLKSIEPETYDDEVRNAKIIKERRLQARPTSIVLNIRRGPVPERLRQAEEQSEAEAAKKITASTEDR